VARGTLTGPEKDAFSCLGIARDCYLRFCRAEATNVANQIVKLCSRKRKGRHLILAFPDDVRDVAVRHAAELVRVEQCWRAIRTLRIGAVAKSAGPCKKRRRLNWRRLRLMHILRPRR